MNTIQKCSVLSLASALDENEQMKKRKIENSKNNYLNSNEKNFDRGHAFYGPNRISLAFSCSTLNTSFTIYKWYKQGKPNWRANLWFDLKKEKKKLALHRYYEWKVLNVRITWREQLKRVLSLRLLHMRHASSLRLFQHIFLDVLLENETFECVCGKHTPAYSIPFTFFPIHFLFLAFARLKCKYW